MHVVEVDIDKDVYLATSLRVMSVPTLMLFVDGSPSPSVIINGFKPLTSCVCRSSRTRSSDCVNS